MSGTPECAPTESARSIHAHPSPTGRQGHRGCPLHHHVSGGANARTLWIGLFFLGIHPLINSTKTGWRTAVEKHQANCSEKNPKWFEPFKVVQLDLVAQKLQKLDESGTFRHVAEQLLLRCLWRENEREGIGGSSNESDEWVVKVKKKKQPSGLDSPVQTFDKWPQTWSCCWSHAHQTWQWAWMPEWKKKRKRGNF